MMKSFLAVPAAILLVLLAFCAMRDANAHDLNYDQCMGLVNTVHIFFQQKSRGEKADKAVLGSIQESYQRPGSFIQDDDDLELVKRMWDAVKATQSPEPDALATVLYSCLKNDANTRAKIQAEHGS